jgi:WD40 repeat protein
MKSLLLAILFSFALSGAYGQGVSYRRQVAPILAANCNACHAKANPQSGLDSTTFAALMKGGKRGKSIVAGDPKRSLLIQYIEGTKQPRMPIGGALKPEEIALIRKWIAEGAKSDGAMAVAPAEPSRIKPLVPVRPQVASLLWSKDGSLLAAGTYQEVLLLDPASGRVQRTLKGHEDVVRALTLNPEGTLLAAGAGVPAVGGEVRIWTLKTGAEAGKITGHADSVYGLAWREDGKQIATGSYDKIVKLWDPEKPNSASDLKEHSEAVFAAAYSPSGKYLATAGSDKAIRIWDAAAGKRLYTMAGHVEAVTALAFHPTNDQLVSVSADKSIKFWNLKADSGENTRTIGGQADVLNDVRFSPDGKSIAVACSNGTISMWNAESGAAIRTIACGDSPLSLAFRPDGQILAVGSYDGSLKLYSVTDGKLSATLIAPPKRAAGK